jgi:hypothetical protein
MKISLKKEEKHEKSNYGRHPVAQHVETPGV